MRQFAVAMKCFSTPSAAVFQKSFSFLPLRYRLVFTEVTTRASQLLSSSLWTHRRSAITAMLVIMEYTSDYFRPTLQTLFSHLRPSLHDSVPAVRRKAALFFSETADYCSDIFSEAAPFLPEELQQLLNGDEFEVISALYILESFPSLYHSMSSQDVIQFVVWILLSSFLDVAY